MNFNSNLRLNGVSVHYNPPFSLFCGCLVALMKMVAAVVLLPRFEWRCEVGREEQGSAVELPWLAYDDVQRKNVRE